MVCKISKTDFQDGGYGGHLGFPINMILAHFIQKLSCCYRASFDSNRPKVWKEMLKIDFQDGCCGGHLGFWINTFLVYFDPEVVLLLKSTERLGRDVEN